MLVVCGSVLPPGPPIVLLVVLADASSCAFVCVIGRLPSRGERRMPFPS
jgi:hypothetical protein